MFVRFYRFFIASHDIAIEASKTVSDLLIVYQHFLQR